jgi:hypothetical protein
MSLTLAGQVQISEWLPTPVQFSLDKSEEIVYVLMGEPT